MGGGAWPFLVGGLSCLVNSVNERDLLGFLGGAWQHACRRNSDYRCILRLKPREGKGNNRSVMPFDVLGRTRATLIEAESGMGWCLCASTEAANLVREDSG
jgi:hypothetical protein